MAQLMMTGVTAQVADRWHGAAASVRVGVRDSSTCYFV
jgi:hypothetical protein